MADKEHQNLRATVQVGLDDLWLEVENHGLCQDCVEYWIIHTMAKSLFRRKDMDQAAVVLAEAINEALTDAKKETPLN